MRDRCGRLFQESRACSGWPPSRVWRSWGQRTQTGSSSMFVAFGRVDIGSRCGPSCRVLQLTTTGIQNWPEPQRRIPSPHCSVPPLHTVSDISGAVAATCRYFYFHPRRRSAAMTPSHGVRHDRKKGSGRLGYLPLASTIRVKQRELSLKRLGPCWDAPRSQRTLPACDDDSQSSRRRCPFRGSGVPHQRCRGRCHWHSMLPTAGVQLQFWNAVVVVPGGVWTSLVDARYEPRPAWHPASGLVAVICRRQPTNLEVVCSVSHSAARSMPDGCHWDTFFTFSLGSGDGAARQLPVFPPSSTP